ncbi:uncharacterized protein LOC125476296 [Pyrus x bretschneideri]|uniref:uncharacterized protein LOC125476296 n=1 Tax=Pyrus x bretschneideri TaxID=225117 RepID=UPI00202F9DD3|nr:uncharacterized protein LOC125476296 [Pyrus x bretschneideri]
MINTNRDPRRNKHHRQSPPNMIGGEGLYGEFDPIFVGGNGNAIGADGNVFSVMGNNASFRGNGGLGFAEFPNSHSHHHHTNYASPPPFMVPTNAEAFYGVQFAPTWNPKASTTVVTATPTPRRSVVIVQPQILHVVSPPSPPPPPPTPAAV